MVIDKDSSSQKVVDRGFGSKKELSVDLANNCTIQQGFIESHIAGN